MSQSVLDPHLFISEPTGFGTDFNLQTNTSINTTNALSWMPTLWLSPQTKMVKYLGTFFACDRESECVWLPIGSDVWLTAPNYIEPYRSFMNMVAVNGLVFLTGGRQPTLGKYSRKYIFNSTKNLNQDRHYKTKWL